MPASNKFKYNLLDESGNPDPNNMCSLHCGTACTYHCTKNADCAEASGSVCCLNDAGCEDPTPGSTGTLSRGTCSPTCGENCKDKLQQIQTCLNMAAIDVKACYFGAQSCEPPPLDLACTGACFGADALARQACGCEELQKWNSFGEGAGLSKTGDVCTPNPFSTVSVRGQGVVATPE